MSSEQDEDQGSGTAEEAPAEAEAPSPAASTQELPRVVLGQRSDAEAAPVKRVLPGRVHPRPISLAIMALVLVSGALSVWFAWGSREWSLWMVVLGWSVQWFWSWLYMEAWVYRRSVVKYWSALMFSLFGGAMAWLCHDRAAAQVALGVEGVFERARALELDGAALLLVVAIVVVWAHLVWLGRGWREKEAPPGAASS